MKQVEYDFSFRHFIFNVTNKLIPQGHHHCRDTISLLDAELIEETLQDFGLAVLAYLHQAAADIN